ncbi:MAG: MgtC/SapB family protein [Bdellovibrionales bacterium]
METSFLTKISGYWTASEISTNIIIAMNILGALALGLLVGFERFYRGRAAGMRTYGFVCMASCALIVVCGYPEFWYGSHNQNISIDPGRVMQGIVTGIGFLGAGVIMRDGMNISGLTTAASIWGVAVIGILVGLGFYAAAITLAVTAGLLMMWGSKFDIFLPAHKAVSVTLNFHKNFTPVRDEMNSLMAQGGYAIAKNSFSIARRDNKHEWHFVVVTVSGNKGKSSSLIELGKMLSNVEGIENFNLSHARN